jgi:hypothetical protein
MINSKIKFQISLTILFIFLCTYQIVNEIKKTEHIYQLQFIPFSEYLDRKDYNTQYKNVIDNLILNKVQNNNTTAFLNKDLNSEIVKQIVQTSELEFHRAVGSERDFRTIILKTKTLSDDYKIYLNLLFNYLNEIISKQIIELEMVKFESYKSNFLSTYKGKFNNTPKIDVANNMLLYNGKIIVGEMIDSGPSRKYDAKPYFYKDLEIHFNLQKIGEIEVYNSNKNKSKNNFIFKTIILHLTVLITLLFLYNLIIYEARNSKK